MLKLKRSLLFLSLSLTNYKQKPIIMSGDGEANGSSTTTMGPPPPQANPKPKPESSSSQEQGQHTTPPMGPPPPTLNPNPNTTPPEPAEEEAAKGNSNAKSEDSSATTESERRSSSSSSSSSTRTVVPYSIPEWSGPPCHQFCLEVLKDGAIVDKHQVFKKGAYLFGRVDLCDFVLEHPTISRFHAVIQFKRSGDAYIYDLGSTHGTSVNKKPVEKRVYVDLHVGDIIRFGQSSRLYIFQGPAELMPPEADLKIIKESKLQEAILDREASLRRAREEASFASWGMGEDAVEEAEDDADEITWQTYKGKLTEKQEKTREKIIKRTEKIAHMKKEIDAIRAKDIAQGGLTQGQQTQIARNEQRMTQIMEELENLEETLNDSIRESTGARAGSISGHKKKGPVEDDEDYMSDEDEFYDRTKKKSSVSKGSENQSVETADTLLDKRDTIMKEIEGKKDLLLAEKNKVAADSAVEAEAGDALDAFMSGLSSQLVFDKTKQLEKEMSTLQSELDRIVYLLKIADPTGEAAKKRDSKTQETEPDRSQAPTAFVKKQPPLEKKKISKPELAADVSKQKEEAVDALLESSEKPESDKITNDEKEGKTVYTVVKPQWLGAVENKEMKETKHGDDLHSQELEADEFVGYKDRKKVLTNADVDMGIETAAPGLIIRKRKLDEKPHCGDDETHDQSPSSSGNAELAVQDAVALLLKHKRGYHGDEDEGNDGKQEKLPRKDSKKKPKRLLGPEKPSFLDSNPDYETWVPPEGQSGDGRTSLNDRYGY